ncbi:hypothetical protein HQ308_14760 [Rhodococcus sp. BP-241]|uniref:hypothetical protein n=1 Tax=Rhodococcus sp. BP-241 TaxID=2739441 RepID=UPI001C9A91BB|nr:hypothetical protein [Rhodococcus sp. BP-241]MBY6708064.1 hypothetical protein [Rhodococcus sp. BP-241]
MQLSENNSRKWWFSEQGETFTARVTDDRFLLGVRSGFRPVGAADRLRVEMEERTMRRPRGGVRVERTMLRVTSIERAPVQDELRYEFGDDASD